MELDSLNGMSFASMTGGIIDDHVTEGYYNYLTPKSFCIVQGAVLSAVLEQIPH